jgi:hypothetical protein
MLPVFPLGVLRDRKLESTENAVPKTTVTKLLGRETLPEEQPPLVAAKETNLRTLRESNRSVSKLEL